MKNLLWLGLIFLSASWLFFVQIFILPDYFIGLIFLIFGISLITISFFKCNFEKISKKYIIVLIPTSIFVILIPFPYNLGCIVITIGIFLYFFKIHIFKTKKANWIFPGLILSGIILNIQILFLPIYNIFASHYHRADFFSSIISFIGEIFGLKTSLNNGLVFVQTFQQTFPISITYEKLGFYLYFNIFIGALLILFFLPKFKKFLIYFFGFFLLSIIYICLRFIFVIFIINQIYDISIIWDAVFLSFSFLPFALLLIKFLPLNELNFNFDCLKNFKLTKKYVITMILIFIFIFSSVGAFLFQDPGTKKNGRILIDELHSDWENSSRKMDKTWYGMLSTYNYYCWAEWLGKYYFVDKNINNTLSSELLKFYDILILKCPTNSYSQDEIRDIIHFVYNGGGLYLIGDHTNVFGMNYYLNQVSENFGITFKMDSTYELGTGMISTYKPDILFVHPVIQNMEQFDFLTSCSLNAPLTSENIIIGNRVMSIPGTYATETFFGTTKKTLDFEHGLILQSVALKYGKGRILAFTDSTCFSNFCVFMDGYEDFNLGVIEYLNRVNAYSYLNIVFIGILIISFILIIYLLKNENKMMIIILFLIIGLLSFLAATSIFLYVNIENYRLPSAHLDYIDVCFEKQHSDIDIGYYPIPELFNSNKDYGTFYVWTQRIDFIPSLEATLENAIKHGDIVVIINPDKIFLPDEIDAIINYIKNGGNVLLMDSVFNNHSTANQLLNNFNICLYKIKIQDNLILKLNEKINLLTDSNKLYNNSILNNLAINNKFISSLRIKSNDNISIIKINNISIAVYKLEKGKIVVVVDSYIFSNKVMGATTFVEPNEQLKQIYDEEFYIFEEIIMKDT